MGNPKQRWTLEEEEALRAGIEKYGPGKWKCIKDDPEFGQVLFSRTNIDLKDKWRNISVITNGQMASAPSNPAAHDAPVNAAKGDYSKCSLDAKTTSKYNSMIHEALSALKDPNGSDFNAIAGFIEQRHEVSHNFRRLLTSRLRKLFEQDKIEKVRNCYRTKKDFTSGIEAPTSELREIRSSRLETYSDEVQAAAKYAASMIADAENKMFIAMKAKENEEIVLQMADEADLMLEMAQAVYEKCCRGEPVLF